MLACTSTKPCSTNVKHDAKWRLEWGQYGGGDFCETACARLEWLLKREKFTKTPITTETEPKHWSR